MREEVHPTDCSVALEDSNGQPKHCRLPRQWPGMTLSIGLVICLLSSLREVEGRSLAVGVGGTAQLVAVGAELPH